MTLFCDTYPGTRVSDTAGQVKCRSRCFFSYFAADSNVAEPQGQFFWIAEEICDRIDYLPAHFNVNLAR